jgi:hypothetical protein
MDAKVTGPDTIQLQLNDEERGNLENSVITAGFVHELLDSAGVQMGTTITEGTDTIHAAVQEDGSLILNRSQAAAIRSSLHLAAAAHHLLGIMLDNGQASSAHDTAETYLGLAGSIDPALREQ